MTRLKKGTIHNLNSQNFVPFAFTHNFLSFVFILSIGDRQMRNRGISSVVPPVVVITIILSAASYFLLTQKSGKELPVYPGAALSEIPESWSEWFLSFESHGISASMYTTEASSDEVLDWYRSEMSERGWSKILDNTFDNSHGLSFQKENEEAVVIENKGTLILIHGTMEQFQAVAEELLQMFQATSYPVLVAYPRVDENTLFINVTSGAIPAGDWQYSVSSTSGSYSWVTGTEELSSPYVTLGTFTQGIYYVSLRFIHPIPIGHIYFADVEVIIS